MADPPDWLIVQYNPFSYGRWGYNPYLPAAVNLLRRRTGIRVALMIHEAFVSPSSWKNAILTTWQRWQWWSLCHASSVVFTSVEEFGRTVRTVFPRKRVVHLPVGSNVPVCPIGAAQARFRLGIGPNETVLGLFGTNHISRLLAPVRASIARLKADGRKPLLLYIGPDASATMSLLPDCRTLADGPLPENEVSRRFAAMDVYLAPFSDGVSTRRTTVMTALQHGVPVVGMRGRLTDQVLQAADGTGLLLCDVEDQHGFAAAVVRLAANPELRSGLGRGGAELYDREFNWPTMASRLIAALEAESSVPPVV